MFGDQRIFFRDESIFVSFYSDLGSIRVLFVLRQLCVGLCEFADFISKRFFAVGFHIICRSWCFAFV